MSSTTSSQKSKQSKIKGKWFSEHYLLSKGGLRLNASDKNEKTAICRDKTETIHD